VHHARTTRSQAAILWNKAAYQYVSKIGYDERERDGIKVRVRSYQKLGKDYHQAVRLALDLAARWKWTIQFYKESRPGKPPCWLPDAHETLYRATEGTRRPCAPPGSISPATPMMSQTTSNSRSNSKHM
jgi:hypothetical protein